MKITNKYMISMAGVIGAVLGMTILIPSILKENYLVSTLAGILMVIGFILLGVAFGD